MARPLRIEFADALYHVTARGDRRESIFVDDEDRFTLIDIIADGFARYDAVMWSYCLMSNHYHLVLQTRQPNLSLLMRHINGVYTQRFNRRHDKVGHLFQGRFKAILVDREAYLFEVCRYVELNPVRARMVQCAADWPWSSYSAHTGRTLTGTWLATEQLHGLLLAREPASPEGQYDAQQRYAAFVAAGAGQSLWADGLRQQIYLGGTDFVTRMQAQADAAKLADPQVPRAQRASPKTVDEWLEREQQDHQRAARCAHQEGGLTLTHIAKAMGVSLPTVSRWVNHKRLAPSEPGHA